MMADSATAILNDITFSTSLGPFGTVKSRATRPNAGLTTHF
jgi:hypothetical protein